MIWKIGASLSIDQLLTSTDLQYSVEIMAVQLSPIFKVQLVKMYGKSKDPIKHLETIKIHMTLYGFSGEIACKAFPLTLEGAAHEWFGAL